MKKSTFLRSIVLLLVMIMTASAANAQCTDVELYSQLEVNQFSCTTVTGNLLIAGSIGTDITDLSPLSSLTSVGGTLEIYDNPALTNLDGLSSLTSVGEHLGISSSPSLTNLDGLSSLTSVGGDLWIAGNSALNEFCGLFDLLNGGGLTGNYTVTGNAANPTQQQIIDGGACTVVCPGDITLSTQAEVDAFDCNEVTGNLFINGPDITDLSQLSSLTSVGGNLFINSNSALSNLDGLSSITSVGGFLNIVSNSTLSNLDGLSSLNSVGWYLRIATNSSLSNLNGLSTMASVGGFLHINSNDALSNLDGLSSLTSVGDYIEIHSNSALTNLDGLSSLNSLGGGLYISSNSVLSNLDGISSFTSLEDDLVIQNNTSLSNLNSFSSLTSVGGILTIAVNTALSNLDGLSSLNSVGGNLWITTNAALTNLDGLSSLANVAGTLNITDNDALTNLNGLSSLTSVGLSLTISDNDALTNLDGLSSLNYVATNLNITNNSVLTEFCGLYPLFSIYYGLVGSYNVIGNLDNPTQQQIIDGGACPVVCPGDITLLTQAEVDAFDCNEVAGNLTIGDLLGGSDITNLNALSSLTSVGLSLDIYTIGGLTNLDGLSSLTSVGADFHISGNSALTNLDGLSSLTSVGGRIYIAYNNALTNLDGLSSFESVGDGLDITQNSALTNLDGLSSLTSVGGRLYIRDNDALTNLDGLSSIPSVGSNLTITFNDALTNLDGLSHITSVGEYLYIINNTVLTEFCGLYPLLSGGGLTDWYNVMDNASNPTQQQIIDAGHCLVGDLVINEIMNNPAAVSDGDGEWFEVYNASDSDIDMIGMTIRDDDNDSHEIATSLVVPAGGYVVLGINADAGTNGGVAVDYEYESFFIANGADEVVIEVFESVIDQVSYDGGATFPDPTGASMSLDPGSQNATDNDDGANWCEGSSAYGAGDFGTPGAENDICCDIQITSVTVSDEGCPGANDGYISIGASCTTCTDMEFSIDGSTYQSSNEFTNVSSGIYSLYARDVSNYNCLASDNTNINPGVDYTQPVITCPADISVSNDAGSCDAIVTFSVTASDNCDPSVAIVSTPASGSTFPVGTTTVNNMATDASGNNSSCTFDVTVNDTEAPSLTAVSTPITLWPPNHKYETISMSQLFDAVSDNCNDGLTIDDVYITSVSSDEEENGSGDGNTVDDIVINSDCNSVDLRKERSGKGNGRVYTIYLAVDDGNGNTGTAIAQVYVPVKKKGTSIDDGEVYSESCGTKSSFIANIASGENQLINYPNPFNNKTTIEFTTAEAGRTSLKVFNSVGYLVATLYEGYAEAGQQYKVDFEGSGLSKGIYLYHLQSDNGANIIKKMILMK